jgi:hypothetical protein
MAMDRTQGKLFDIHVVPEAGHLDILHDATLAENVADRISTFVVQTDRIHLSLWSATHPPMSRTGDFVEDERYTMSIPVMVFFTFVLVSFGLSLEITIGPMMIVLSESHEKNMSQDHGAVGMMDGRNTLHTFAKLLMGPLVFSSLISGSWTMAFPFTVGLWHLGFPELTSSFVEAWTGHPYGWTATTEEDGSAAPPPARSAAKQARMQRHRVRSAANKNVAQFLISEAQPSRVWGVEGEDVVLDPDMKLDFKLRALEMWLFTAFFMHHTAATIIFTANCAGTLAAEPLLLGAIANGLQHAASFLAFFNRNLFLVLLLLCEVWMQLEFFYAMPVAEVWSQLGIWGLIVSHWMFLSEALYGMVAGHRDVDERMALVPAGEGIHARRQSSVQRQMSIKPLSEETRPCPATVHNTSGPEEVLAPALLEEGGQRAVVLRDDHVPIAHYYPQTPGQA